MTITTKFGPNDAFWTIYEGKASQFICNFMSINIQSNKVETTIHIKDKLPNGCRAPCSFYPKEEFCFNTKEDLLKYIE